MTSPPTGSAPTPRSHLAAPFHGHATVLVEVGQRVAAGQRLARVEAVKLEAVITAPAAGTVRQVAADGAVDGGDLVVVLS